MISNWIFYNFYNNIFHISCIAKIIYYIPSFEVEVADLLRVNGKTCTSDGVKVKFKDVKVGSAGMLTVTITWLVPFDANINSELLVQLLSRNPGTKSTPALVPVAVMIINNISWIIVGLANKN